MYRIIGGRRYDTDTATEIHSFSYLCEREGYVTYRITEALYCTPNDRLFVARHSATPRIGPDGLPVEEQEDLGDWQLPERGTGALFEWLEKANASEAAYVAAGFNIEEG